MTIRDFEEVIDRIILGRGYDYYEDEHISEFIKKQMEPIFLKWKEQKIIR
nr:hypothetical protein [uncultured Niameybacter sp.]